MLRNTFLFLMLALLATFISAQDTSSIASAILTGNPAAQSNNPGGAGAGDFGGAAPDNSTSTLDTTVSSQLTSTSPTLNPTVGTAGGAGTGDTGGNAPSGASGLWVGDSYVVMALGPLIVTGLFVTLML